MRKSFPIMIAAMSAGLALAGSATAAPLITNGSFTSTTGGAGQINFNTTVTGWTVNGTDVQSYDFVFPGGPGPVTGVDGSLSLYSAPPSQDGGNFIGVDPAYQNSPTGDNSLNQSVSGLVNGQQYALTFDWATAQQSGYTGSTVDQWQVTLGSSAAQTTPLVTNPSTGFTGWYQTTMYFTATTGTENLSFLALGPGDTSGQPPFALLDGVSMVAVPEPTTWALMIMGFGGVGAMVRSRRRQAALA